MHSHRTEKFKKAFDALPESVKEKAREAYKNWRANPHLPSLAFKQIAGIHNTYSIRIGRGYRALGVKAENKMIWFWIGSHEEYNNIINQI